MHSIVGPYAEVEAAYRRERITAEFGNPVVEDGTRRHHPVRTIGRAIAHRHGRRARVG
jgi:hypothetical protein